GPVADAVTAWALALSGASPNHQSPPSRGYPEGFVGAVQPCCWMALRPMGIAAWRMSGCRGKGRGHWLGEGAFPVKFGDTSGISAIPIAIETGASRRYRLRCRPNSRQWDPGAAPCPPVCTR